MQISNDQNAMYMCVFVCVYCVCVFWLPHDKLWPIIELTASLT